MPTINQREVVSCVSGRGRDLREHSAALILGGRARGLPGFGSHVLPGTLGTHGVKARRQSRSTYGAKRPK